MLTLLVDFWPIRLCLIRPLPVVLSRAPRCLPATTGAGRSERLGCSALRLPMNCLALFSQERSSANRRHSSRDMSSARKQALREILVERPDGVVRDHVERTRHRECGNRRAAGQRLELHDAEGVGAARKDKDVGGRQMRGQIRAGLFAQKFDLGIFVLRVPPFAVHRRPRPSTPAGRAKETLRYSFRRRRGPSS